MTRPRRFAKTLFLDTLKCFFEGKKDLFKGLYIYEQDWEWTEYPIVKLDFNEIEHQNSRVLAQRIDEQLEIIGEKYGVKLERTTNYEVENGFSQNLISSLTQDK